MEEWLSTEDEGLDWASMVEGRLSTESQFAKYVERARALFRRPELLGEPPEDLAQVLTEMALASPAVAALRALGRAVHTFKRVASRSRMLAGAARVALDFRSLFNLPPVIDLVRRLHGGDEQSYWRAVLDYCAAGNLQAVLDEYVHTLRELNGLYDSRGRDSVEVLVEEIGKAVSIRTVNLGLDEIRLGKDGHSIRRTERSLRCRFALRYGDGTSTTTSDERAEVRREQVREAFNSPFWPFVLATTSIGQEGLDFHPYCSNVFHWNLPSNPVDLEQREGRVHRYKGHAIRRNVAETFRGSVVGRPCPDDPWDHLFEAARATFRAQGTCDDVVPYWVFPNGRHSIRRFVPTYPFSRDQERLAALKRGAVMYRFLLGQPRQEDLLAYLQARLPAGKSPEALGPHFIDLSPPPSA